MKNKKTHFGLTSVIVVSLTVILFLANYTAVFASEATDNTISDATIATDEITPSADASILKSDAGSYITKTLVETTYKTKVFAKFLTSDWAKTNHYDIDEGYSYGFSFGYSYEGETLSITGGKTYSVGYTVSADPTKWSKLAAFADFTIKKYLVKRYTTGGVLLATSYSYTNITTATYVAARNQL